MGRHTPKKNCPAPKTGGSAGSVEGTSGTEKGEGPPTRKAPKERPSSEDTYGKADRENVLNSAVREDAATNKKTKQSKQTKTFLTLIEAAREGKMKIVSSILKKKSTDVDMVGENDNTSPLHEAAFYGHVDVAQALLKAGANPRVLGKGVSNAALGVSSQGATPLHFASGNMNVVRALLDAGADIDKATKAGGSSLHWYCFLNRIEATTVLSNAGASVNAVNKWGSTPLHIAASLGHAEIVPRLVEGGAGVNCSNSFGRVPLSIAAAKGHLETVKALKAANAESKCTKAGVAPIHMAAANGHSDVVAYLAGDRFSPNMIDKPTKDGRTPLHYAASHGKVETVNLLLELGARRNPQSKDGRAPLHLAVSQGHLAVVEALAKHKVNVNIRTADRSTPLHMAASQGLVDIARALLLAGAGPSLSKTDDNLRTPKECSSNAEMEELLRECGNRFSIRRRVRSRGGPRPSNPPPRGGNHGGRGNGGRGGGRGGRGGRVVCATH